MSTAKTLSTIILALGPEGWFLPAWQARTKEVILPFDPVATSASTQLEAWQLTILRKFARRIRSIKQYDERVKFIRRGYLHDPILHQAPEIWDTWVEPYLKSWDIQSDIEDILTQFDRHPSQMLPTRSSHFDHYLMALIPFAAERLFGIDAYINPTEPFPILKDDLHRFTEDLLPIIWKSAIHTS